MKYRPQSTLAFGTLLITLLLFGIPEIMRAQSTHFTPVNLGLGGGGAAYMDSYHANFINPANIAINNDTRPPFTLGLIGGLSFNAGGPLANVGVYNKYFTKGYLLNDVGDQAFNEWFGSSFTNSQTLGIDFSMVPLGLTYRRDDWAVSAATRLRVLTDISMNRGFFEMFSFGINEEYFGEPKPLNMSINVLTLNEVSAGFSMKVWEGDLPVAGMEFPTKVYAGAAPKLLMGIQNLSVDLNSTMEVQGDTLLRHDFNYTIETVGSVSDQFRDFHQDRHINGQDVTLGDYIEPEGADFYSVKSTGLGMDLGVNAEFGLNDVDAFDLGIFKGKKFARVAMSVTDIGKVSMDTDVGRFQNDDVFEWRGLEYDQEEINAEYDSTFSDYTDYVVSDSIANGIYLNYTPQDAGSIEKRLPTTFRFGTQLQLGRFGFMMDFTRTFVDRGVYANTGATALGLEYKFFGFWPIRVGLRTGGIASTSYSFGTGLEFKNFEFTFAGMYLNDSSDKGTYAATAFSGLVFHF